MQGVLNLSSYLIGGFIIGLISPGIRIREPGVGAFLAIAGAMWGERLAGNKLPEV